MEKEGRLKPHALVILVLLILQYLLGMATNLFVQFPQNQHEGQLWEFAWKQLPLASHIILGVLLVIGSLVLLIRSILQKNRRWIISSAVGFLAILIAGMAGSLFIPSQMAVYSFVMALCFIIAVLAYCIGIYVSRSAK